MVVEDCRDRLPCSTFVDGDLYDEIHGASFDPLGLDFGAWPSLLISSLLRSGY